MPSIRREDVTKYFLFVLMPAFDLYIISFAYAEQLPTQFQMQNKRQVLVGIIAVANGAGGYIPRL